ncbi:hypothetical protein SHJG_8460 [Streptomyces hygroscopicus subsp. jinggangensis 5008]|nr:hypothetical protein SHJG_8460 [Streptomyces hygroscopicus subsp. jinggangensis 5008]AGF67882.1 hypothetical protein SHJGH_8220 [Streptomyces hygroscopicus subsp. jinggangensis TL01]
MSRPYRECHGKLLVDVVDVVTWVMSRGCRRAAALTVAVTPRSNPLPLVADADADAVRVVAGARRPPPSPVRREDRRELCPPSPTAAGQDGEGACS